MKATLKFDFDDPNLDDEMKFRMAVNASNYYWALYNIKQSKKSLEWLFDANPNIDKYDALEKIFEKFYEIIDEHNILFEF